METLDTKSEKITIATNETETYETDTYSMNSEYWDEISNISSECEFTMCFYCNEEIYTLDLPYHTCVDKKSTEKVRKMRGNMKRRKKLYLVLKKIIPLY